MFLVTLFLSDPNWDPDVTGKTISPDVQEKQLFSPQISVTSDQKGLEHAHVVQFCLQQPSVPIWLEIVANCFSPFMHLLEHTHTHTHTHTHIVIVKSPENRKLMFLLLAQMTLTDSWECQNNWNRKLALAAIHSSPCAISLQSPTFPNSETVVRLQDTIIQPKEWSTNPQNIQVYVTWRNTHSCLQIGGRWRESYRNATVHQFQVPIRSRSQWRLRPLPSFQVTFTSDGSFPVPNWPLISRSIFQVSDTGTLHIAQQRYLNCWLLMLMCFCLIFCFADCWRHNFTFFFVSSSFWIFFSSLWKRNFSFCTCTLFEGVTVIVKIFAFAWCLKASLSLRWRTYTFLSPQQCEGIHE